MQVHVMFDAQLSPVCVCKLHRTGQVLRSGAYFPNIYLNLTDKAPEAITAVIKMYRAHF